MNTEILKSTYPSYEFRNVATSKIQNVMAGNMHIAAKRNNSIFSYMLQENHFPETQQK